MSEQSPYAHLLRQVRGLLGTEARMGPRARARFSWMVRADVLDTHCTVIKGGANTLFVMLGDQRREGPFYPEDAAEMLRAMAQQQYALYLVHRATGGQRRFYRLSEALAVRPRVGDRIYGLTESARVVTHDGRASATGALRWIRRSATSE